MQLLISMHSFNALQAGDVYGKEYGTGYFYEQDFPQQAFDKRLQHILNHVHTTLGKPWKELNDYIFAFEAENEAMIGKVGTFEYILHTLFYRLPQGQQYIVDHQYW
jgi:mannan endo-1,4-beta-mannosidase